MLEGRTESGFETYKDAEDYAEEEIAIISQNGLEKEIPLEDITYEINYVRDYVEDSESADGYSEAIHGYTYYVETSATYSVVTKAITSGTYYTFDGNV